MEPWSAHGLVGHRRVAATRLLLQAEQVHAAAVAEEIPIGLQFQGFPHVVLMGTPGDVEDLAVGFAITDGVCRAAEITGMAIRRDGAALVVDIGLAAEAMARFLRARRERSGRSYTSCGVCGLRDPEDLPAGVAVAPAAISKAAIRRALQALPDHQLLNRLTGAVHAAAWADAEGMVQAVREDVGRHNALDKLIGARARAGLSEPGFCVVTSRCSFEMVQKATAAGMGLLVGISAPTTLAIAEAERTGLALVALARADSQIVYVGQDRLRE